MPAGVSDCLPGVILRQVQASKNQQDGEELIRKAQRYVHDTKAHARKNAAAAASAAQQLAEAQEALCQRSVASAPST